MAPIDGLFYRGRLWFSIPPGAQRARHLRKRPQVSATYVEGEDVCLIVHGSAREVGEAHRLHEGFSEFARDVYGPLVDFFSQRYIDRAGPDFTGFIEPRRIYAQRFAPNGSNR